MRIALGCDHGGLVLKNALIPFLRSMGHTVEDFGTYTEESCDYPDYAAAAAQAVADGDCDRGIVICTTGIGVSIVANKIRGIRCALLSDLNSARMTRLHNDTNMMALGAAVVNQDLAFAIVDAWLSTHFSDEDRHQRRIDKMMSYERGLKKKRKKRNGRRHSTLVGKLTSLLLSILLVLSLVITPITTYVTDLADPSRIVDLLFSSGILGGGDDEAAPEDPSGPAENPSEEPSSEPSEDATGEAVTPDNNEGGEPAVASLEDEATPAAEDPSEDPSEEPSEEPTGDPVTDPEATLPQDPPVEGSGTSTDDLFGSLKDLVSSGIIDQETLNSMLELPEGSTVDTEKMADKLMNSEAAKELVDAYVDDILNSATTGESTFNGDAALDIINPHIGELIDIVEECLPEGAVVDRTALEEATKKALEVALPAIVDALPAPDDAVNALAEKVPYLKEALKAIDFIRNGSLRACALLLVMIFIVALCIFRIPGLRGLLCIGICGVIGALLCGGIYLVLSMPTLNEFLVTSLGQYSTLVTEFAGDFAHEYAVCAVIYGVIGLVLILGTTVVRKLFYMIFSRR